MRKPGTRSLRKNTPGLRLVGGVGSGYASTIYGCESPASTTSQATNKEAQLLELLNSLERSLDELTFRYLEVSSIFTSVMTDLVKLGLIGNEQNIIDKAE